MKNGYIEISRTQDTGLTGFEAVIINIANKECKIVYEGRTSPCLIPGSIASPKNALAVGDRVKACDAGGGQFRLLKVMPRRTAVYRGDRRSPGEEILVAANAEYLLAVVTAEYLINQAGFLEAAAIASRRAGIPLGIFVSRWDMAGEQARALLRNKLALYRAAAYPVFAGSSREIHTELLEAVRGKTVVVTGDRGCGKTTLIRTILYGLGEGDRCSDKIPGTSASVLYTGLAQTRLIDTPGFRSFALAQITEPERNAAFPEIARLTGQCRFRSCTHVHEEGCSVIEALRSGDILRERYNAFQSMAGTAQPTERCETKADYRHTPCTDSFVCKVCGEMVAPEGAGSQHRNHCPKCLSSVHVDVRPGDRASLCNGVMEPVSVWVRKGGEWAIIHRCRLCGALSSNRIAADDNPMLLMSIAVKPLSMPPFPLNSLTLL